MDNRTQQYRISILPCPETGGEPSTAVVLEITGDPEVVRQEIKNWKTSVASYKDPGQNPSEEYRFLLHGGDEEDVPVFCGEEEILSVLISWFSDEAKVKELRWRGSIYTDISLSDLNPSLPTAFVTRLQANKDGRGTTLYLATPTFTDNVDDLEDEWRDSDDDAITESFEDYLKGKIIWRLSPCLSSGVVEAAERQIYAGTCPYVTHMTYLDPSEDADGNPIWVETESTKSRDVHLFLETEGQDFTFSALLDGKLYKKLSRDGEKIVFYSTPLDPAARDSGLCQGQDPHDVIFQNAGGQYRCQRDLQDGDARGFSGAVLTDLPETPDFDSLDPASAGKLYRAYLLAFCEAVSQAEVFKPQTTLFQRGEDGLLHCETEDFHLTGKRCWPVIKINTERLSKQYSRRIDKRDIPVDWDEFKESYDQAMGLIQLQSVSFIEEGTENLITLFPKDAYILTEYEKDPWGDDALDDWGNACKRYIHKDSALEVLIAAPQGEELYRGDFGELRKGNVFGGVNLPETIQFSKSITDFERDIEIYRGIKKGILDFSVRRIVNLFTRNSQMGYEEMARLLYANGEVPDDTVTAAAMRLKRRFSRTGEIPDIALVGQAGTGKSTMVANLARIFGKEVYSVSGADLKGSYMGHTEPKVVELLAKVLKQGNILFIDEAYELMSDRFGREAMALLLPIMSRNRTSVEARTTERSDMARTISIDFKKREIKENSDTTTYSEPGFPPIWMAGYEDEIRMMLGTNKGLYRRVERLSLKTPSPDELYGALCAGLERLRDDIDVQRYEILTRQFRLNREMLLKFFRWAVQTQNSRYFANYAGAMRLLNNCVDGIHFDQSEEQITSQLSALLTSVKRDVKRQLDTVRRKSSSASGAAEGYDDTEQIHMIYDNNTRFRDLVGCDSQIQYMNTIIDMLVDKNRYDRLHMTVPKGALLLGPPGVGKTFIARAMAGELQARLEAAARREALEDTPEEEKLSGKRMGFMSLSAPELISKPVSFIGSVFDKAEEHDVCVIFIDEVDAIAKNRFANPSYAHFIELIKQMDGVEQRSNVFILAATNAPESLDPAFVRSGRIDKKLTFTLPDSAARRELAELAILRRCCGLPGFATEAAGRGRLRLTDPEKRQGVEKLAEEVASITVGRTPGDIENLVNTAFIMRDQDPKRQSLEERESREEPRFGSVQLACLYRYLYEAMERANIGDLRPVKAEAFQTERNDSSRSSTAVHEVGHALVNILQGQEPFEKITSLPRGGALGYVMPSRKRLETKADFEDSIRADMGGRIAEEIVYGSENISTGASADIAHATRLAHMMVERWGFSETFGFMALVQDTAVHLGESKYICSESFRQQSDQTVNALLKRLYQETRELLADKKELIETLAEKVFTEEAMSGRDFIAFYSEVTGKKV